MPRIIKIEDIESTDVSSYERDKLEAIVPEQFGGKDYVDPAVILAEAREEAERKVREAYEEGMRRGLKAGEAKFEESVCEAARMLGEAAGAIESARREFLDSLEPRLFELATAIAAHILKREAELSHDLIKATTRSALEHLTARERVTLYVNPDDLEAVRRHKIGLLDEFDGMKDLDVVADETIAPGGCKAETDALHVDADIDKQIEVILDAIRD